MAKIRKKNIQGVVDLNQVRLEENEKSRPSVAASQKVPSPKKEKKPSERSAEKQMPTINEKNKKIKPIGNVSEFKNKNKPFFNRDENGKLLFTRRNVLYGAIGAGALLAVGTGVKFATDKISNAVNSIDTLNVSKKDVINSDYLLESENKFLSITQDIELPYGSLAWANDSNFITCLIPNDVAKPLATVELINMDSGKRTTLLDSSIGQREGFEIYDARANEKGIIWTEVNILQGEWRIFASDFSKGYSTNPVLLDTGGTDWETPTIAVAGNCAYWQVLPNANGSKRTLLSSLKKVDLFSLANNNETTAKVQTSSDISDNKNTVYTSMGRMSTPVYAYKDGIVITPRANSSNIYYQLTYIDNHDEVKDSICLPQNMRPLEAGYGQTGFNFSFDAIYNYGEGISNLGTYTPMSKANDNYTNLKWLNFSRNPSAAPAWYDDYFIIRSTMAICAVDLKNQTYCVLDRPNASDDYGDYLASSGQCNRIVTYANIYDQPITGEERKYCSLRIWT